MPKAQYRCCSVPTPVTTLTLPRRSAVARGSGPIGSCHGLLPLGSHTLLVRDRVGFRVRVRVRLRVRVGVRVRVRVRVRVEGEGEGGLRVG